MNAPPNWKKSEFPNWQKIYDIKQSLIKQLQTQNGRQVQAIFFPFMGVVIGKLDSTDQALKTLIASSFKDLKSYSGQCKSIIVSAQNNKGSDKVVIQELDGSKKRFEYTFNSK
ncbi:MAG: hypothetical protein PUP46_07180 [Endozoicomonas sp. (ex Botrylloides leachii)]|nr:hypothetical protein [Endozoicomonas sp. (ex Botrylloides leachii)]